MYALSDKPAAIREVQKFLHVISDRVNRNIPRVAIDGIYGDETAEAVRIFQEIYNINPSGLVDRVTFDTLFIKYRDAVIEARLRDYIITDEGFPIKVGSQSNDVIAVHLLITELAKTYSDIGNVGKGSYFSENSRNATIELQRIFRFPLTGEIDAIFFERMKTEVDALKRANEVYE